MQKGYTKQPTKFDLSGYTDKNVIDSSEETCEATSDLFEL